MAGTPKPAAPAAPVDDAPPADASFEKPKSSEKPFDDTPFDAGVEADEESDPKKFIEQLTGKLGQSLRKYNEEQGQPDFELEKFAINSLLSATHTSEMDAEDQKDIISKVKSAGKKDEEPMDTETPSDKPEGDETPVGDDNLDFGGEGLEENLFLENPKKNNMFQPGSNDVLERFSMDPIDEFSEKVGRGLEELFKANKISGDEYKNALEFLSDKYYHLFHKFGRENIYYAIKDILNSIDQDSLANSPLVGFRESKINEKIETMEKESNNYMFWSNLKTIHHASGELLKMDYDKVDALLSDGHGWALDHMATSADDVEEVYHFIENTVNGYHDDSNKEQGMEDEWAKPMELHTEAPISDDLKYHLENSIPLNETIYRIGSEKYFNLVKEVKALHSKGLIKLNENDAFIVNEFDNQYIMLEGKKIKMNFIYEDAEAEAINEAEYQGKKVELGKPKRGGSKKFYVYVRDPKSGNIKKVSFGAKAGGGNLAVKLRDPKARKAFADRHNCPSKTDRTSPGYWACRLPRYAKSLGLAGGGTWW